ncbi:MAG: adenylyltransferase/cytidyltransferase family protein [Patescibacteria group bacterium]
MRVMVFGTFDNFHPGHQDYFRQARRFGEKAAKRFAAKGAEASREAIKKAEANAAMELIAVVARDQNVLRIKGRLPHEHETRRIKKVRMALKDIMEEGVVESQRTRKSLSGRADTAGQSVFRARAVLGAIKNQWAVLEKYRPEIICLGYDQKVDMKRLKSEIAKSCLGCKIKRMRAYYPKKYKSSYCLNT